MYGAGEEDGICGGHRDKLFDLKVPLDIPKGDACLSKKATKVERVFLANWMDETELRLVKEDC